MDYSMIILLVIFVGMIFFMFRSNKKRQQQAAELQASLKPGTKVMTSAGIFGTVTRVDTTENKVWIESTPGTVFVVHSQSISQVMPEATPESVPTDTATAAEETVETTTSDATEAETKLGAEPEFGERLDTTTTKDAPAEDQK